MVHFMYVLFFSLVCSFSFFPSPLAPPERALRSRPFFLVFLLFSSLSLSLLVFLFLYLDVEYRLFFCCLGVHFLFLSCCLSRLLCFACFPLYLPCAALSCRPKDPITYARNDFELMEVSLLREMLRLQFQAQADDPKVRAYVCIRAVASSREGASRIAPTAATIAAAAATAVAGC